MGNIFDNKAIMAAFTVFVVALLTLATVFLQNLSTRMSAIAVTTIQTETLVNAQRSALEKKIELLEQKIESNATAAAAAAAATSAIVLESQRALTQKDKHISDLAKDKLPVQPDKQ